MASSPSSRGVSPSPGAGESPVDRVKPRTGDVAARDAAAKLKAESKRKEIADMMRLHRASRAAQSGNCYLLSDLISEQASIVASQDFQGRTLVHLAAAAGQGDAIRLLAAQGADMDARDNDGMAPLHIAAINAQVGAAAALLEQRADPLAVDTSGAPAGVSRMSSRVSSKSETYTKSSDDHFGGKRPIFYAFRAGCPGLVEVLRRATSNAAAAKQKHAGAARDEASPSRVKEKQETKLANDVDPREDDPGMEGLDDQARGLFRLPVEMLDDAARRAADAEEEAARNESKMRDEAAAKQVAAAVGEVESKEAETGEGHEASTEQVLEEQAGGQNDSKPSNPATHDLPERPPQSDQSSSAQSPAPAPATPAQGTQSAAATATATATGGVSRAAPPPPVPHPPPGTYASPLRVQFELPGGDPDSVVFASSCPHEPAACGRVVTREQPLVLVDPSSEDGMSGADLAAADAWLVARLGGGKGGKGGSSRQDLYDDMVAMGSSSYGAGSGAGGGLKTAREREAEARADRVSQARAALATISKDRRVPAAAMEVAGLDAHWDALEAVADPGIPLRNTMARVEALRQRFRAGPQPPPEPAVLEDGNPTTAERRRRLEVQRQARTSETASGGAVGSGARMQAQASAADAVVRGRKLGSAGVPQGDRIPDGPRSNPASAVAEEVANERAALVAEGALRVAQQQQQQQPKKQEGAERGSGQRQQGSSSKQRVLGGGEQGLAPVDQAEERVAGDGVPVKRGTTRFVRATVRSPDGRWSDVVTLRYRLLSPLEQFFDASPKALWSAEGRLVAFGLTSLRRLMSADRGLLRRAFSRIGILQRQSEALIQALKREWRKRQLKEREEKGDAYVSPRAPARQQPDDRESPEGATSTRGRGQRTRDGAVSPMGVAGGGETIGSGRGPPQPQPHLMAHGGDPGEPSVVLIGSTADAHVLGNNSAVDGVHSRLQEGSAEDSEMRALAIETGAGGDKRGAPWEAHRGAGAGAGAGVVPSSPMGRKGLPLAASPASTQGSDGNRHTDLAAGSISLEQGSFAGSEVGLGRGGAVGGGQSGYYAHAAHGSPGTGLRQLQRERESGHGGALGPVRSLTSASAERLMARQHVQQHQEGGDSAGSGMKRHVSFQS